MCMDVGDRDGYMREREEGRECPCNEFNFFAVSKC